MSIKSVSSLVTVALLGAGLAACGGGASTGAAGGSGTGGTGASSTIVAQLAPNSKLSAIQRNRSGDTSLAAAISDLLLRKGLAATAGVQLFVYDANYTPPDTPVLAGTCTTDANGMCAINVAQGNYYLCTAESTDPANDDNCSDTLNVEDGEVLVVSDLTVAEDGTISYVATPTTLDEAIALYQDSNNAKKTIICHKNKVTISVGTPAAKYGHLAHGDTLGVCPTDANTIDTTTHGPPANPGKNGNKGNNGNNGNHGNPNTQTS